MSRPPGRFEHTLFQKDEFYDTPCLRGFVLSNGWWGGKTRLNALYRKNAPPLHLAIIGGGPAGCGLLTNYALNGKYKELLDRGVAIFESSPSLGGGVLGKYSNLRSNSHGCAFFDAITGLGISIEGEEKLNVEQEIPMTEMHRLQLAIGAWHEGNLSRHSTSFSQTGTTVVDIHERASGDYCIRYSVDGSERILEAYASNVCICTGGIPYTPSWVTKTCESSKIEFAQDYFKEERSLRGPKVAIVGFSHTAFSLGDYLTKNYPSVELTFIQRPSSTRTQPRIYFPSKDAAEEHSYAFEHSDVCPDTNRVHRFGGLRGDARAFALSKIHSYNTSTTLNPSEYNHIIVACGYQLNSIPMKDRSGATLEPTPSDFGTAVDCQGRLFPDHQLYAFGIGAGLTPDERTGGEPGCTRRADGVWLYQHTVGSIIREALNRRSTEWVRIYNRIGMNASLETPLHHIGGYDMFTQVEWDCQVKMLLAECGILNLTASTAVFESGVGGGAFVDSLRRLYGCEDVEGCDTAESCVEMAKRVSHSLIS